MCSILTILGLVALIGGIHGDYRTNQWADSVFSNVSRKALDPMNMARFTFNVSSNGSTNRDVKADFLQGRLSGLSKLARSGDCTNGTKGADYVIGCYVKLQPIVVQMNADVKGDVIRGVTKHINTQSNVASNTTALIEFYGRRTGLSKATVSVKSITLSSRLTGTKLDLNTQRMNAFITTMNTQISGQINNALTSYYQTALFDVAKTQKMP